MTKKPFSLVNEFFHCSDNNILILTTANNNVRNYLHVLTGFWFECSHILHIWANQENLNSCKLSIRMITNRSIQNKKFRKTYAHSFVRLLLDISIRCLRTSYGWLVKKKIIVLSLSQWREKISKKKRNKFNEYLRFKRGGKTFGSGTVFYVQQKIKQRFIQCLCSYFRRIGGTFCMLQIESNEFHTRKNLIFEIIWNIVMRRDPILFVYTFFHHLFSFFHFFCDFFFQLYIVFWIRCSIELAYLFKTNARKTTKTRCSSHDFFLFPLK